MKKYAVIVAAGSGRRMGTQAPKQFLLLRGKTVLWHTLTVFLNAYADLEIILVLPEEHIETGRSIMGSLATVGSESIGEAAANRIRIVSGGETRFHSVKKGLEAVPARERSVIFVHDGVRCLLTTDLIHRCCEEAMRYGSAIPVVDSRDSVRLLTDSDGKDGEDGESGRSEAIERKRVKLVQTPQTFLSTVILPAYDTEYQDRFTDEAAVVEAFDGKLHLIEGELTNIKITTPMDMIVADGVMGYAADRQGQRD